MTQAAERLKAELAGLGAEDRAELADFLLSTFDAANPVEEDEAWEAELERRVEEIRSGKIQGVPASEVFARARKS